ncbi:hypothetical protein C2845_PM04G34960 [Panicum miliaceum]|uniref:GST C-terminal domain-containing protein n=1 Tax=Panicum miliaceum TaxID=4540 RepID=A0A3L6QNE7_PANMI|nr:hypothetical protein C2845_PM04G34960 [Panicum miliaceum]
MATAAPPATSAGSDSAAARAGRAGGDEISELVAPALDKVEEALGRFSDGPFFLGQSMSAVDMVYAPFVERFKDFFAAVKQYDMTRGRPWIEELNKIDAYAATWGDRRLQIAAMMIKFGECDDGTNCLPTACSPCLCS